MLKKLASPLPNSCFSEKVRPSNNGALVVLYDHLVREPFYENCGAIFSPRLKHRSTAGMKETSIFFPLILLVQTTAFLQLELDPAAFLMDLFFAWLLAVSLSTHLGWLANSILLFSLTFLPVSLGTCIHSLHPVQV